MGVIEDVLCAAKNSNSLYMAAFNDSILHDTVLLLKTPATPASIDDCQWQVAAQRPASQLRAIRDSSDINNYWCTVDDQGTFLLMSEDARTSYASTKYGGIVFDPTTPAPTPADGGSDQTGAAIKTWEPVSTSYDFECQYGHKCRHIMYAVPGLQPGAVPAIAMAMYRNRTYGIMFATYNRTSRNFVFQPTARIPLDPLFAEPQQLGYLNGKLLTLSASQSAQHSAVRLYPLNAQGLPLAAGRDVESFDVTSITGDCPEFSLRNLHGVHDNKYYVLCQNENRMMDIAYMFDGTKMTKIAELASDGPRKFESFMPVPPPVANGTGAGVPPTWIFAHAKSRYLHGTFELQIPSGQWRYNKYPTDIFVANSSYGDTRPTRARAPPPIQTHRDNLPKITTGGTLSGGAIVGLVMAVLTGVCLAIFGVWRTQRANHKAKKAKAKADAAAVGPIVPLPPPHGYGGYSHGGGVGGVGGGYDAIEVKAGGGIYSGITPVPAPSVVVAPSPYGSGGPSSSTTAAAAASSPWMPVGVTMGVAPHQGADLSPPPPQQPWQGLDHQGPQFSSHPAPQFVTTMAGS
ncbi:hypothetical protein DFQ27_008725 [Actinomortierella ambigua]|uniref:Uncharacterized protein n=1 Tax=Actinomortierella ambigua TaxID=1343610 RepID=A0A9P6PRT4_9FUNG|nr:hypothetical protein DFQ27_008725 [Actinomortierella ambigua]